MNKKLRMKEKEHFLVKLIKSNKKLHKKSRIKADESMSRPMISSIKIFLSIYILIFFHSLLAAKYWCLNNIILVLIIFFNMFKDKMSHPLDKMIIYNSLLWWMNRLKWRNFISRIKTSSNCQIIMESAAQFNWLTRKTLLMLNLITSKGPNRSLKKENKRLVDV